MVILCAAGGDGGDEPKRGFEEELAEGVHGSVEGGGGRRDTDIGYSSSMVLGSREGGKRASPAACAHLPKATLR
jgi:hypothetical protein